MHCSIVYVDNFIMWSCYINQGRREVSSKVRIGPFTGQVMQPS